MAVQPGIPFWFKQRQGKAEPAGDNLLRLKAPNIPEAFIGIRQLLPGRWHDGSGREVEGILQPILRETPDGADLGPANLAFASSQEAWEAAFEMYRTLGDTRRKAHKQGL